MHILLNCYLCFKVGQLKQITFLGNSIEFSCFLCFFLCYFCQWVYFRMNGKPSYDLVWKLKWKDGADTVIDLNFLGGESENKNILEFCLNASLGFQWTSYWIAVVWNVCYMEIFMFIQSKYWQLSEYHTGRDRGWIVNKLPNLGSAGDDFFSKKNIL